MLPFSCVSASGKRSPSQPGPQGYINAPRPCWPERLRGGRTVRRYEDEIHTDGETAMTMNLHTQTSVPNTAPATSVSPLEQSGSSKTKFSKGKAKTKADVYQVVTDRTASSKHWKPVLSRGCVRGSVTVQCRVSRQISPLERLTVVLISCCCGAAQLNRVLRIPAG